MTESHQFSFVVLCMVLAGCAQQQQQSAAQQALSNANAVCQSANANPAITPILGKVSISVRDITLEMRERKTYVADADKLSLEAWEQARKECYGAEDEVARFLIPQIATINRRVELNTDVLIARLYSGQITYGEFNTQRMENVAQGGRQMAVVRQQVNAQNQQMPSNDSSQSEPLWKILLRAVAEAATETAADMQRNQEYQNSPQGQADAAVERARMQGYDEGAGEYGH